MDSRRAIARFWKRFDGASCFLYKREDGWYLTIEKEGATIKTLAVPTPAEAIQAAREWRNQQDDLA
jgi:hypothetical protein